VATSLGKEIMGKQRKGNKISYSKVIVNNIKNMEAGYLSHLKEKFYGTGNPSKQQQKNIFHVATNVCT
jgi:hypothetical protein